MEAANKAAVAAMHIGATTGRLAKNIVTESNDNIQNKNDNTSSNLGFLENGRLPHPDTLARKKGFKNYDELVKYKEKNPELYNAMDGVKYGDLEGSVLEKRNFELSSLQSKAKEKIIERIKNIDINELKKSIEFFNSNEWQNSDTSKKHSDIINTYVDDWIALENMGYFNQLSQDERTGYVTALREIKQGVQGKNFLYTNFNNINEYNSFIMNNTAELEDGMSTNSIQARVKAYENCVARLDVIKKQTSNMSEEEKWTKKASSGSGRMIYSTNVETKKYKALLDEKEYLEEQIRLYERYNKKNDSLATQFVNSADFAVNSVYIPQKDSSGKLITWDVGNYRAFLDYYSVGTDALVHSERVRNGLEPDDYWYGGQSRGWDYATEDEFKMLNYLANTQGDVAAQSYYDALSKDLTRRRRIAKEQKWDENYKNAEWYEKIGLNILSVPEKLYGNTFNAIEDLGNLVTGQEYDPYAAYRDTTSHADNTRKNTAIEIEELTNNAEFLGVTWGDAYQAVMSGVDSIAGVATFGGKIYPVIAGMGASSAKAKQLYEQGASNEQIAVASIFAGVTEMAFEKISIGHFLDEFVNAPAKKWYQLLGKSAMQGGIEMSEEMATELSNIITDTLVLGSRSEWEQLITSYKQQGYSDTDAVINAMWDKGGDILEAGICGLISGGTMGGGGSIINTANAQKPYIDLDSMSIDSGYNSAVTNSKILSLIKKVKSGIFNANDIEYLKSPSEEITKRITEITGIDVSGFKVAIEARQIEHILKDHGENGKTDRSMSNDSNIAKMEYVLNSPDSIVNSGTTKAYVTSVNGKNKPAQTILYEKNLNDNLYYVVQAVPDTKSKTLYIVSAFIGKKGYKKETSQTNDAISPEATPKSENASISNYATLDGVRNVQNEHKPYDVSSDASNYDILNTDGNVNNLSKEAGSRNGLASSFVSTNKDITITPRISENDGIRTIGVDKSVDEKVFVEGLWEGAENTQKNNVEKSQLESVENTQGNGIIEETRVLTLDDLTKDVLKTKPPNSRIPSDWIKEGGSIEIDKYGNWIYTDKFGISVKYINGYPDYRGAGVVFQMVNIGRFTNRGIDKRLANKLAPNGPCKKGHVWHHSQDGYTMEEISKEIHERFTHKGGYSLSKREE